MANSKHKIVYILLTVIILTLVKAGVGLNARYTNASMRHNSKYISSSRAWVQSGTLNLDMTTAQPLVDGLRVLVDISIKLSGSKRYQSLFKVDIDLCKLFSDMSHPSLISTWVDNMFRFGNFMKNCPVEGYYYIRNMTKDSIGVPVFLRAGDYAINSVTHYRRGKGKKEMVMEVGVEVKFF